MINWMKIGLLGLFLLVVTGTVSGQEEIKPLRNKGFEVVDILQSKDTTLIAFEHRYFRNPAHSIEYAKRILERIHPVKGNIQWVLLHRNRVMGVYDHLTYSKSKGTNLVSKIKFSQSDLATAYQFQFRLHPTVEARFGRYDRPLETKLGLILDTRVFLLRGLSVQSGIWFPVQNSLDTQEQEIRMAPSQLNYFWSKESEHFVDITLGTFYGERYGLDLEYRWAPLNQALSFGFQGAFTGYYNLYAHSFYSTSLDDLLLLGDIEYFTPIENVSLKITAGQFLFESKGARLDVIRQFGMVDIGLFGAHSNRGQTFGFQLACSLFPGKILSGKKWAVRSSESFRWQYSYNNVDPVALNFRKGHERLADVVRQYRGRFMENQSH
ncbi:YjbH domain-containing protein [Echinicola marina]|uniref:YjbH domain-containing protein n=1 Tax=Echinicola marina TaxID=2859768 RepID=UPI001CF70E61|nr:YjbH domain-containing protein [Echinicola marina]UCS93971.1 YjbH domain-containing protein [Echinicola marina]